MSDLFPSTQASGQAQREAIARDMDAPQVETGRFAPLTGVREGFRSGVGIAFQGAADAMQARSPAQP